MSPGPAIAIGDAVYWSYVVTNTGNVPLTSWTVIDDQGVNIACPRVILTPSASATCVAKGIARVRSIRQHRHGVYAQPAGWSRYHRQRPLALFRRAVSPHA